KRYNKVWDTIYNSLGYNKDTDTDTILINLGLPDTNSGYSNLYNDIYSNAFLRAGVFRYISASRYSEITDINDNLYVFLSLLTKMDIPKTIEFKSLKPGEQATNTFNVLVLKDNSLWYQGELYNF